MRVRFGSVFDDNREVFVDQCGAVWLARERVGVKDPKIVVGSMVSQLTTYTGNPTVVCLLSRNHRGGYGHISRERIRVRHVVTRLSREPILRRDYLFLTLIWEHIVRGD